MHDDHDPIGGRYLAPAADPDLPARTGRLRDLDIGDRPDREFDDLAAEIATTTGMRYAMVNFIGAEQQYFAGLYPAAGDVPDAVSSVLNAEAIDRTMPLTEGFCPHVVDRRLALPLEDVCAYPRFAGNAVVDKLNIRSYLGAPVIDDDGVVLGTVCVVDKEAHPWTKEDVAYIKDAAARVAEIINRRARQAPGHQGS